MNFFVCAICGALPGKLLKKFIASSISFELWDGRHSPPLHIIVDGVIIYTAFSQRFDLRFMKVVIIAHRQSSSPLSSQGPNWWCLLLLLSLLCVVRAISASGVTTATTATTATVTMCSVVYSSISRHHQRSCISVVIKNYIADAMECIDLIFNWSWGCDLCDVVLSQNLLSA